MEMQIYSYMVHASILLKRCLLGGDSMTVETPANRICTSLKFSNDRFPSVKNSQLVSSGDESWLSGGGV